MDILISLNKIPATKLYDYYVNDNKNGELKKMVEKLAKTEFFNNMDEKNTEKYLDFALKKLRKGIYLIYKKKYTFLIDVLVKKNNLSINSVNRILSVICCRLYVQAKDWRQNLLVTLLNYNYNLDFDKISLIVRSYNYLDVTNLITTKTKSNFVIECIYIDDDTLNYHSEKSENIFTKYNVKNNMDHIYYLLDYFEKYPPLTLKTIIILLKVSIKYGIFNEIIYYKVFDIIFTWGDINKLYRDCINILDYLFFHNLINENMIKNIVYKLLEKINKLELEYNLNKYFTSNSKHQLLRLIKPYKNWNNKVIKLFISYTFINGKNEDSEDEFTDILDHKNNFDFTDNYILYRTLLKDLEFSITEEYMKEILKYGDELFFKYLTENSLFTLKEPFKYAFESCSYYILEQLVLMKHLIKLEDLKNIIDSIDDTIINLLNASGFVIDLNFIKFCFENNLAIEFDVTKYIELDEKYYYLCYKHGIKDKKLRIFNKKITDYEKKMSNFFKLNLEELKMFIKENNIIPNQYCYDLAYIYSNCDDNDIVKWLEKEYNFKPTILTLINIPDIVERFKLYNKYFLNSENSMTYDFDNLYTFKNFINCNVNNDATDNIEKETDNGEKIINNNDNNGKINKNTKTKTILVKPKVSKIKKQ